MAMTFTQTDTDPPSCAATSVCSGRTVIWEIQRECTVGGTAGSSPVSVQFTSSATNGFGVLFLCTVPSGSSWDSGTWTVRLNVTTANMNFTWTECYVCRANSSCVSQETLGSNTAVGQSLGTTGVKSTTVSCSAATPAAGDLLTVILIFSNAAMSTQSFSLTPNQNIDSPFTAATKLYLRNTQANNIGATYYDLLTTAGASADTGVVNAEAAGTEIQWTKTAGGSLMNFISPRLAAGVTLTSADLSIWAKEDALTVNAGARARVFKRASGGTETELGGGPFDDGVEFTTTDTEYTWTANFTDTAFVEDDRILLKLYITNVGIMVAGTATLTFNAADAATGDSFMQLAQAVTFKAESTGLKSLALTGVG